MIAAVIAAVIAIVAVIAAVATSVIAGRHSDDSDNMGAI